MNPLQALRRDERAATAVTFTLCLTMMLPALGAAIDYSFASFQKTSMQRATDAAALAGARLLPANVSGAGQTAREYFQANGWMHVSPSTTANAGTVTVEASFPVATYIMKVMGKTHVEVSARSVAARGNPKVPCVLTLEKTEKEALYVKHRLWGSGELHRL